MVKFKNKFISYQWFIGIDVSKQTLDITILNNNEKKMYEQINNTDKSIKSFLKKLISEQKVSLHDCIFCLEHTGIYNSHFFKSNGTKEAGCLHGIICADKTIRWFTRGKNDKIDSFRIAMYAFKNKEFLTLWQPERNVIRHLKRLSGVRERLINARKQITNTIKEDKKFIDKNSSTQMMKCCKQSIKALQEDIKKTDEEIKKVIESDDKLKELFSIIESVL